MSEREQDPKSNIPPHIAEKLRLIEERKAALAAERSTREAAESLPPFFEDMFCEEEETLVCMEREEADAKAWRAALSKYGKGRVVRIQTPDGLLVMRAMTLQEQDAGAVRIGGIEDDMQRQIAAREVTLDYVVHPAREKAAATTTRYPGLWVRLYAARDALAVGEADSLSGKA